MYGRCWALDQYEQGGYLGSPILSSAVFSTRDHRGADLALPRPAVNSTVPLTRHGRTDVLVLSRVLRRVKACTEPRHYGRKAGHGGTRATDERRGTGATPLRRKRGTAAPALRMNEAWPRGAGTTEEKAGHWGICASEEYVRWLRDVVRKRGTCCRARWQSVRASPMHQSPCSCG